MHLFTLHNIVALFTLLTVVFNTFAGYINLKKQTTNGDGRPLRQALDDLADAFAEHRGEVKAHLDDIKERLSVLEAKNHLESGV